MTGFLSLKPHVWAGLFTLLACASLGGCVRGPAVDQGGQATAGGPAPVLVDVPPPPNVDAQWLEPRDGDALVRANMTLDQIVASVEPPDYLKNQANPQAPPVSNGADNENAGDGEPPPADNGDQTPPPDEVTAAPGDNAGSADQNTTNSNAPPDHRSVPRRAQRLYALGRSAWRSNEVFEAKSKLQAALAITGEEPGVLRLLGIIDDTSGHRGRGAYFLRKAVAKDPDDVASLFLLGRYAAEQTRQDEAIAVLSRVLAREAASLDTTIKALAHFYLGSALLHPYAGYDRAGIEQYEAYLSMPRRPVVSSLWNRQLHSLRRLEGTSHMHMGDAYHRLNQPVKAHDAYAIAARIDTDQSIAMIERLVYTQLRLGDSQAAVNTLAGYLQNGKITGAEAALIRYTAQNMPDQTVLVTRLEDVYIQTGRPQRLALALAQWLQHDQAITLLVEHLSEHPRHEDVFTALLQHQIGPDQPTIDAVSTAARTTVAVIMADPGMARLYTRSLFHNVGDLDLLIQTFNQWPWDDEPTDQAKHQAVLDYVHGQTLRRTNDLEGAMEKLSLSANADETFLAPRYELARLAIIQNDFQSAERIIDPILDSQDGDVIGLMVKILAETDRTGEALVMLDRMLQGQPSNVGLICDKAMLQALRLGQPDEAERTLLDALDAFPTKEDLYAALFVLYDSDKPPSNATNGFTRLVRRMQRNVPHTRIARLKRAEMHEIQKDLDKAQREYHRLLDEDPNDFEAFDGLMNVLARSGRKSDARKLLNKYLTRLPKNRVVIQLALKHYQERDPDEDKLFELAERLILLDRPSPQRAASLATVYLRHQRADQAVPVIIEALDNPQLDDPRLLLLLLGETYNQLKTPDLLDPFFHQAIKRFGDQAPVLREQWAQMCFRSGRNEKAADLAIVALEHDPEKPQALVMLLTRALSRTKQWDRLDEQMRLIVVRFADIEADVMFQWAMSLASAGKPQRAEALMTETLVKHPNHPQTNNGLGYQWTDEGKHLEEAHRMIEIAHEADPGNEAYLDSLGWVYYKMQRFTDALRYLKLAEAAGRQSGAGHPVILDHLGDAYLRLGRKPEALRAWTNAMRALNQMQQMDPGIVENDPELHGMPDKINDKAQAVRANREPAIADAPGLAPKPEPDALPDAASATPNKPVTQTAAVTDEPAGQQKTVGGPAPGEDNTSP